MNNRVYSNYQSTNINHNDSSHKSIYTHPCNFHLSSTSINDMSNQCGFSNIIDYQTQYYNQYNMNNINNINNFNDYNYNPIGCSLDSLSSNIKDKHLLNDSNF